MSHPTLHVDRRPEVLLSDDKRVIPRYLDLRHPPRIRAVFRRVMRMSEPEVQRLLARVLKDFAPRHRNLKAHLAEIYQEVSRHIRTPGEPSEARRLLIASYFTMEYSIESAALFNPSIVLHPDQSDLPPGSARFLMSLRATGEGHVSSIVFRRGVLDARGDITFDPPPRYAYSTRPLPDALFERLLFLRKLRDIGAYGHLALLVFEKMPEYFTHSQLKAAVDQVRRHRRTPTAFKMLAAEMLWLARANYEFHFPADCHPAEIVIFPATEHERRGMEDLRAVRFVDEDGHVRYYGTYTAYDGSRMHPMLLETGDFRNFHVSTLTGRYAKNKGMALFPRRVDGQYLMLSRHDGQNLYLLRSHDLYVWNRAEKLQSPTRGWELLQVGNCGSPLETEAGWIVLTHGVGPMRRYCIGVSLLDRNDPARVIGSLSEPLIVPTSEEREGYVPNVVYSCGSMIHNGRLIIPYAVADSRTTFATVAVQELLAVLTAAGP